MHKCHTYNVSCSSEKEVVDPPSSDDASDEFKAICREFDDYFKNSQEIQRAPQN